MRKRERERLTCSSWGAWATMVEIERVWERERLREGEKKSLISYHTSERYNAKYIKLHMKIIYTLIHVYILLIHALSWILWERKWEN